MGIFGKAPEAKQPQAAPARPAPAASQPATPQKSMPCVIGAKTVLKGELTGDEDVIVEGTVEGEIRVSRDVKVGPSGVVRATIQAASVIVSGELVGDCNVSNRVEIAATGRVTGNIRAPKIVIAEGAVFKGTSDMSARSGERSAKAAAAS